MQRDLYSHIAALLARIGLATAIVSIETCRKGGNNRTYRVMTDNGMFAAKQYFRHESDTRDRLATEFAFLSYASTVAPAFTPKPYAMDEESGIAIYEFIDGQSFEPGEVGPQEVSHASRFFQALNLPETKSWASVLPVASEACFSIRSHIDLIDRRLARLTEILPKDGEDKQALELAKSMAAQWQKLVVGIGEIANDWNIDAFSELESAQRCISPSDFGFHNALRETDGRIRFLDFEYAGWDDPAKMAGDFFAQLAVPVPDRLFEPFVRECLQSFVRPVELIKRAELLRPLYQVKWCCIALNVFLPEHIARRKFANPLLVETALKRTQLAKAYAINQSLETSVRGLH